MISNDGDQSTTCSTPVSLSASAQRDRSVWGAREAVASGAVLGRTERQGGDKIRASEIRPGGRGGEGRQGRRCETVGAGGPRHPPGKGGYGEVENANAPLCEGEIGRERGALGCRFEGARVRSVSASQAGKGGIGRRRRGSRSRVGRSKRRASSPGGCHGPWRTSCDP